MRYEFLLAFLTFSLTAQATPQSATYSDLVVFGDSLSDNGNFFAATGSPPAPYWSGRFCNGPVWVEQMANHLGLSAATIDDRAVGFAKTQDVLELQVLPYLSASGAADGGALYVYWAGANDLFGLLETPGGDAATVIGAAMQNTANALVALVSTGAQHVMVANLPDLSATPFVVELGDQAAANSIHQLVQGYNAALAHTIRSIEAGTGIDLIELDAYNLTKSLVRSPISGGFRVADARALSEQGVVNPRFKSFLFWDHVHPTTQGHSFIMGEALGQLGVLWGDVDGNGQIDGQDVPALLQAFGPSYPGNPADLDGDGTVNGDDLYLLRILRL